jgi:hypothetical protein
MIHDVKWFGILLYTISQNLFYSDSKMRTCFNPKVFLALTLSGWLILFGTACQGSPTLVPYEENLMNVTQLDLPLQDDYVPIYLQDGSLLFFTHLGPESDLPGHQNIQYLDYNSDPQTFQTLPLPVDKQCSFRTEYWVRGLLPDGRIGVFNTCFPSTGKIERYLMAFDWQTKALAQLVKPALPYGSMNFQFTWNPDMTQGVQEVSNVLAGTIYWITPDGTAPINVTISDGKRGWSLEDTYYNALDDDTNYGIARLPTWSPDGNQIAFVASIQAISRLVSPIYAARNIYLLDPVTEELTMALENIYGVQLMEWSPDNQWLAFDGQVGPNAPKGLWLFAPQTGRLLLIYEGEWISTIAWEPNMDHLVISRCLEFDCLDKPQGVFLLDIKGLVP